ncbi:MAG TPA: hypothetical protein VGZ29_17055 [Terriglobia bacterium]|nr:hypothetical protein [Terriglobia bacterium]
MKVVVSDRAIESLKHAGANVQRTFEKQLKLLEANLQHPSLRAKKYDKSHDTWQARVNRNWRFYFMIQQNTYIMLDVIPHPK